MLPPNVLHRRSFARTDEGRSTLQGTQDPPRPAHDHHFGLGAGKSLPESLVFDGQPRLPQTVSQTWMKVMVAAKVEATFHSLRHTHASHLIAAGVDILRISRRLGHSSPTVTLNTYGHLMPQTDDMAASAIEAALSASTEMEQMDPVGGGIPVEID